MFYTLQLADLSTDAPYAGATLRACGLTDLPCMNPITEPVRTDEEGYATLRLTENFDGYIEIQHPSAVPYLFHLPGRGLSTMLDYPLAMISQESFVALAAAFRVPADPALGAIGFRAFDCRGEEAEGVRFEISPNAGQRWYFEAGLPSISRQETDELGLGGFMALPPGVYVLSSMLPDGRRIASKSVYVRGGWMAAGYARPEAVAPE